MNACEKMRAFHTTFPSFSSLAALRSLVPISCLPFVSKWIPDGCVREARKEEIVKRIKLITDEKMTAANSNIHEVIF